MSTFTFMSVRRRPRGAVLLAPAVAVGLLALAACGSSGSSAGANGPVSISQPTTTTAAGTQPAPASGTVVDQELPAAVESLPLQDQDGHPVTLASLKGKTVVVSPNLTLCQEYCPLISANLREVDHAVNDAGLKTNVEVLEVTVDPGRDDLHHLKAYQGLFGAEPNWAFLRGDASQIAEFWKAFHLSYSKTANDPGDTPIDWLTGAKMTYDVDHENVVYVIGSDGHIHWLIDAAPYINGAPIPPTLEKFLSDDGIKDRDNLPNPDWTAQDVEAAVAYVSDRPVTPAASPSARGTSPG